MSPQDRARVGNEILKPAQVRGCEREQDQGTCETLEEPALAVSAAVTAQEELAQSSSNPSCSEGSPEARAGPTTKMWYFCALKQADCVQIRDFVFLRAVFQSTLLKQGFKNTVMETTKAALA